MKLDRDPVQQNYCIPSKVSPCQLIVFKHSDLFPHLKDLLIVLIVVKRIESSMSVNIHPYQLL